MTHRPALGPALKKAAAIIIIAITLGLFYFYLTENKDVLRRLLNLPPSLMFTLAIGYLLVLMVNAFILRHSLRLTRHNLPLKENLLVVGYSSIVNFFGPLQSGPGFRAAYLNRRHGVKLSELFAVTLLFYIFFAAESGLVLLVAGLTQFGSKPIFIAALLAAVIIGVLTVFTVLRWKRLAMFTSAVRPRSSDFWLVGLGSIGLFAATSVIYLAELRQFDQGISFIQTVVYTAAANLALFVSLTPGAIGFRESFLLLSRQLHGITPDAIIGANLIDRAFYVGFLALLFLVLLAASAPKHLKLRE